MTRCRFLLTILFLIVAASARAQSPEQLFQQANGLYQDGKVAEARNLYEQIASNGYVSGDLYYNLGNAYYRLGDLGHAILNYERARRLAPADEDLNHNLQLASLRVTDRIEPTPRLFIWDYWDSVKGSVSTSTATWITYAMFLLLVVASMVLILGRGYGLRRAALLGGIVSAIFLVGSGLFLWDKISDDNRRDEAVVLAAITTIKNSPDAKSSDAFVLHAGVKVRVIDSVNEWIKIRLADGKVGWMEQGAAETI
jgi:tetratricopeptide (TPR) repeat protein